jgi:hypothetical protein
VLEAIRSPGGVRAKNQFSIAGIAGTAMTGAPQSGKQVSASIEAYVRDDPYLAVETQGLRLVGNAPGAEQRMA